MTRLLWTLGIIFCSFAAGYGIRVLTLSDRLFLTADGLISLRQRLQKTAMFVLTPMSAALSLWGLPVLDARLLFLPFLGVIAWCIGGGTAMLMAKGRNMPPEQAGSLFCCGCFSNTAAIGSLVCVFFLGESTIALVAMYRLCEEIFYFSVGYPVAQWYAGGAGRFSFRTIHFAPVVRYVLLALCAGLTLNFCGVDRPAFCGPMAAGSMVLSTIFFLSAIGMGFSPRAVSGYVRCWLDIAMIKFALVPVVVTGVAIALGYGSIDDGVPLKVAFILSTMPVAMLALVPPSLFNLDLDLANSCWVFSHSCLVLTIPAIWIILHFFH